MSVCKYCGKDSGADDICPECSAKLALLRNTSPVAVSGIFEKTDIENNMWAACVSYIPFGFLLPMFLTPDSKYAMYHGRYAFRFSITTVVLFLTGFTVSSLLSFISDAENLRADLGGLFCAPLMIVWVAMFFWREYHVFSVTLYRSGLKSKHGRPHGKN